MDHSLLDSVDDFVIVQSANDHSLPIRVRELPGKNSQQDADLQNEDIDLVSRPGSVRSLDSLSLTACSLEDYNDDRDRSLTRSPSPNHPTFGEPGKPPNAPFVKDEGLPCLASTHDSICPENAPTSLTGVSARPGQPSKDIHIASIPEVTLSESVNSPFGKFSRSCSSHSEMDKHLVDLLIDHAFQSRLTRSSQEPFELSLRQSIMERLQSLPDQHPVILEAAKRIDSEKQWAKASWFNPAARLSIYEHIFSAVERAALSLLVECHDSMELAIPCAISIHKDMKSWSLLKANSDRDTVRKAFELACTIQSECNMELSRYDLKIWKNKIRNDRMNAQAIPEEVEKLRLGVEHTFRQHLCKIGGALGRNTTFDRVGLFPLKRDAPEGEVDPISQPFNPPSKRKTMPGAFPNDNSLGSKVNIPTCHGSVDQPRRSKAQEAVPVVVTHHANPADRRQLGVSSRVEPREMYATNSNHIAPSRAVTGIGPGVNTFASYNPTQPLQTSHTQSVNIAQGSTPIKLNDKPDVELSIRAQDCTIQFPLPEQHRCETNLWTSSSNPADNYQNAPLASQFSRQQFNDYQYQLMLLEQQNKKRLQANLGPRTPLPPPTDQQVVAKAARPIQSHPAFPPPPSYHTSPDYQMQLMLLEQENKKRLAQINKFIDEKSEELCWLTPFNEVQCVIRNNGKSPCDRVLFTRDAWKQHVKNDHGNWIRQQIRLRKDSPQPFENESHSTTSQLQGSTFVPSIRPQTPCMNQTGLVCSWPLSSPTQHTSYPFSMAEPQELPTSPSDQPSKSATRNPALEDYKAQLNLLELHRKKRLAMLVQHDTEKLKPQPPTPSPKGEVMIKAEPHDQLIKQEPEEPMIKTEQNYECHGPYSHFRPRIKKLRAGLCKPNQTPDSSVALADFDFDDLL